MALVCVGFVDRCNAACNNQSAQSILHTRAANLCPPRKSTWTPLRLVPEGGAEYAQLSCFGRAAWKAIASACRTCLCGRHCDVNVASHPADGSWSAMALLQVPRNEDIVDFHGGPPLGRGARREWTCAQSGPRRVTAWPSSGKVGERGVRDGIARARHGRGCPGQL
jgi:hypothetical protein